MHDTRVPLMAFTGITLAGTTYLSQHDCMGDDEFSRRILRVCIAFQVITIVAALFHNMAWTEVAHIVYIVAITLLATQSKSKCTLDTLSILIAGVIVSRIIIGKCMYNYDEGKYGDSSVFRSVPKSVADLINVVLLGTSLYRSSKMRIQ